MVVYIKSDLEFILKQIKIAEKHAAYAENPLDLNAAPLFGTGAAGQAGSLPTYNLAWGLRTVDGSYNHVLPGQEKWGAADQEFLELLSPEFRTVTIMMDPDGPGPAPLGPVQIPYTPGNDVDGPGTFADPGDVIDPEVRTISNLLVDQTLANPAAILTALQRAGIDDPGLLITQQISALYTPLAGNFKAVAEAQRVEAAAAAAAAASPNNAALQQAALDAADALAAAQATLDSSASGEGGLYELLAANGIELDGANVHLPNIAPDEGLSAPFNSWFTLFGQFFDHGLDLVNKGGNGAVMIPLQPDDPLYSTAPGALNFMVLTRATTSAGADGVLGDNPATVGVDESLDDGRPINTTTSYVDQNQTYTSHASHQVFVRQYELNAEDKPVATGNLIEGANGGMATWAEVKAQARTMLGIELTDSDVGAVPLLRTDQYGNFIPDPITGFAQVITGIGADLIPNTADDIVVSGTPTAPVNLTAVLAIRTNHAFLADIAHNAVPDGLADGDTTIGLNNPEFLPGDYDNELLDAHFIAGDGRVNENIGLTAVHHVFHAEHNRLVQHTKDTVLETGDIAFINEWLAVDVAALPADLSTLVWDGERLFQAAKFGTEMQYQHLVFEEFARKIQPTINTFLVPDGFDTTLNPSIVAEFAHVVYRFGHSMLTESIDQFDPTFQSNHISLIQGFLNPTAFSGPNGTIEDDVAAGAIIRGMTRQVGNQIDEFVTSALRNNLLGLPLDLATINLARGRDTGVPSLNTARAEFYEASNQNILLKPYTSWVDFASHLKNEASIINFIASYGTHELITSQTTIAGKRDAALTLITGNSFGGLDVQADAVDFLNATGAYGGLNSSLGGLNNVDLWIGGLAEETMPFGGMLGSTFNFVFEVQMEMLQSGDRFYYLQRLDGLHLFGEMENNSFAAMIMRNTDATHLPSDVFSTPGLILEVDRTKQYNPDLEETAGADGILLDDPLTPVNEAADNLGTDPVGGGLLTQLVIRNDPSTAGPDTNYLRYTGGDHVVLGGTNAADTLIAGIGDDTLFGDAGNDKLEGGFGNDILNGGDGDDIITDAGGDDNIKAGLGNDVVHAGPGLDLVMGNAGQDFIFLGTDEGSEVFAGEGNDFIFGNRNAERILGNEGNDWIETGTFDGAPGDNFDEIFAEDGINGHDVFLGDGGFDEFIGEGGDDIMVGSSGRGKMVGMSGFDWATYKDNTRAVNADLSIPIIFDEAPVLPANAALDEYESMEGLSGSKFGDILTGTDDVAADRLPLAQGGTTGFRGSVLTAEGIALVNGLNLVVGAGVTSFSGGDIILGGDGGDTIMGKGGDDIIDGDKWLDVQIGVFAAGDLDHSGAPIAVHNSMTTLASSMFSGLYNPGQLGIIRTIRTDTTPGDIDIAKYQGLRSEYAFSATDDGQVIVSHTIEDSLDGTDRLRNIEGVQFLNGNALNIIVGTPGNDVLNGTAQDDLILGLAGADVLNGNDGNDILVGGKGSQTGTYSDTFSSQQYNQNNGPLSFSGNWIETNDGAGAGSPTAGDIEINGNRLRFDENISGNEIITRSLNLTGATAATLSFNYEDAGLDAFSTGNPVENVHVEAFNGTGWDLIGTFGGNTPTGLGAFSVALTAAQIGSHSSIRFRAEGDWEGGENFYVDNFLVTVTNPSLNLGVDTLNGGLGDDTYSFTLGDGVDVINEIGGSDRISISGALTSLNFNEITTGGGNDDLVITLNTAATDTITVADHFDAATEGVEFVNFNGATLNGYLLDGDYAISTDDTGTRNATVPLQNTVLAGTTGEDTLVGNTGNDLLFGHSDDDNLQGGDGDDLLIGGAGDDDLDAQTTGDPDNLDLLSALGADTLVGGAGNDTYGVDDLLDVVVEALNEGTDTVETFMAALSLETMANVENLSYEGVDADAFTGTGNALANIISGGDLNDTLSGLGGGDTLDGGLGADTMTGGDGNDVYDVDEAGDVVIETTADALIGGIDRVESDIDYTLGANVENLDLNGAAVRGTGNSLNNVINGNDEANQLFGAGGNDTIGGGDGNDLLDGGDGNDTINGGDESDIIIGGAGDDTIDVGGDLNTIVYNAPGFGADVISSFDSTGGTAANQDRIDLSGLGVTAANFTSRVFESASGANTLITIRENGPLSTIQGTILINGSNTGAIDISDFTLAAAAPTSTITGTAAANTLNGVGTTSETINALGGNDTVNANGGNDVVNGGEGTDALNGGDGNDTLSGGAGSDAGSAVDSFGAAAYTNNNGTVAFNGNWIEGGGETTSATAGDISIAGGRLQFNDGVDGGETIQRAINLTGATSAAVTFTYEDDNLGVGQSVTVQAWNATTNTWQNLGTALGPTGPVTGTFNATLTGGQIGPNSAIRLVTAGNWDNSDNFYIDNFTVNVTIPGLNTGVDTVNGDAGDDTIIWNANTVAPTDGRDIVNGGTEGATGDTFVINGNASAEAYRIYTRAEFLAVNAGAALNAATEIVVTRNGTDVASIIAELSEIEEIRINGADPGGPSGSVGGDTFEIIGDFSGTSLRPNTITIDGASGDDTIDISSLGSAHRIVFRSNGGNDTILGTLRPQDVIELPEGTTAASFTTTTDANGVSTMTDGTHSITFTAPDGMPQVGHEDDEEDDDDDDTVDNDDEDEDDDSGHDDCDEDTDTNGGPHGNMPATGVIRTGTPQADVLLGTAGDDNIIAFAGDDVAVGHEGADAISAGEGADLVLGGDGRDVISAGDGDDHVFGGGHADIIHGDAGADRIFGDGGNDLINAGAGNDTVFGGAGDDLIVAEQWDGHDVYFGDGGDGGTGVDTLDMSAATADVTVNLGSGPLFNGSASSSQTGNDTIWGIENVNTGSGNDTITASNAANVMNGGGGNDTYRFTSASAADGDTILNFEPGDRVDLTAIDTDANTAGDQAFELVTGAFTAAGQVAVTFDGDVTRIQGNVDGDADADFTIEIAGNHSLTNANLGL